MHFFSKSVAISAFLEKTIKIVKSPYKRAFLVVQNSKKLGHTSLKRRFLSVFDVSENSESTNENLKSTNEIFNSTNENCNSTKEKTTNCRKNLDSKIIFVFWYIRLNLLRFFVYPFYFNPRFCFAQFWNWKSTFPFPILQMSTKCKLKLHK